LGRAASSAAASSDANALLIVECDGAAVAVEEELDRVLSACRDSGSVQIVRAANEAEREEVWSVRRQLSLALRATGLLKINHDVVVPRGRIAELFEAIDSLKARHQLQIASFGH